MVLVVGTVSSIIGAAVWTLIAYVISSRRQRSGAVAGNWYQITYDPKDSSIVWSIEWIEAVHKSDTVAGTTWRIYPHHFDRRWRFQGRCCDARIRAQYWADRGNGGEGSMKLYQLLRSNYLGRFEEEQVKSYEIGPSFVDFAAPIEWIRVGSDDESAVLAKLKAIPEAEMLTNLPRRIRRRLQNSLARDRLSQKTFRALAFGSCLVDMSGPLANEVERVRQTAINDERLQTPRGNLIPAEPRQPDTG